MTAKQESSPDEATADEAEAGRASPDAVSPDAVSPDEPPTRDREQLLRAVRAFDNGNYRLTRELAEQLLESTDAAVRSDAIRLLAQLRTPHLTLLLLALSLLLLTLVTVFAYAQ